MKHFRRMTAFLLAVILLVLPVQPARRTQAKAKSRTMMWLTRKLLTIRNKISGMG